MPEGTSSERLNFLADIVEMYYFGKMSQKAIADKIGVSRSMVSYLLEDAREKGVFEIRINRSVSRAIEMEYEFKKRFSLREVHIIERKSANDVELMSILGKVGADVLKKLLLEETILGLGWGVGVRSVVQALSSCLLPDVQVVQLTGGVGAPNRGIDGAEVTRKAGESLGAATYYMNAPVIMENSEVAAALRTDHTIKAVLDLGKKTQLALAGIGTINPEASSQYTAGYLSLDELQFLQGLGVVGDIYNRFFNILGQQVLVPSIDPRVIGISWQDLSQIDTVLGIATGRKKTAAILGAIRTGLVDILVTDDVSADNVLHLDEDIPLMGNVLK
jgi:deoxyribonucleoside regulator